MILGDQMQGTRNYKEPRSTTKEHTSADAYIIT